MIALLLRLMVYFIHLMDTAHETYGKSIIGYWPTVVYSLLPLVAGAIYDSVVVLLNDFECHPTPVHPPTTLPLSHPATSPPLTLSLSPQVEEEYYLIIKQFAFQFVNRYCALIYSAFYLQDLPRLRLLLASMLITNAVSKQSSPPLLPHSLCGLPHHLSVSLPLSPLPPVAGQCDGNLLSANQRACRSRHKESS
jgi:hypothetical protein